MCARTNRIRDIKDTDGLQAGTSCKDLSALNDESEARTQQLHDVLVNFSKNELTPDQLLLEVGSIGTSAKTLAGVLAYVFKRRPALVKLENVVKVLRIVPLLRDIVEPIGYITGYTSVNTMQHHIRQSRPRVYMFIAN